MSSTEIMNRFNAVMEVAVAIAREELPETVFEAPAEYWDSCTVHVAPDDAELHVPRGAFAHMFQQWALFDESYKVIDRVLDAPSVASNAARFDVVRQVASTVRWRQCAIEAVDTANMRMTMRDLADGEVFDVEADPINTMRRARDHSGVASAWFAEVDGRRVYMTCLFYDKSLPEKSRVVGMSPLECLMSIAFSFGEVKTFSKA